ncbi:ubiquitin-like domain-containing protein [Nocardia salmonicida]|uniref:ubiquitin-like domain-containing protein n=1 Tax=Nocardia salmonicida TaxID=53431 RepID=UPI000A53F3BD|nr:ubiquitin-like domain-containing protein [Nocardia salmonicida]
MRVQHHAQNALGTRLRRGVTVGLIAAAMAVPVAGIASAQPAPPAPPAAPAAPAAPEAPAAPAAPAAPGLPGLPSLPGLPLAENATSITLTVNGLDGEPIAVDVDTTATVKDLKALIQEQTGVPAAEQQLVTESEVKLEDSNTLASYELADGDVVNLALA